MMKTMHTVARMNTLITMDSRYYYFSFARFFAGFFGMLQYRICQEHL